MILGLLAALLYICAALSFCGVLCNAAPDWWAREIIERVVKRR